jgi:CheY-specific phosphatase CheX
MSAAVFEFIIGHLSTVAIDVFAAYAQPLEQVAGTDRPELSGEWVISVIGFGSERLRGALTLLIPRGLATALQPQGFDSADAHDDVARDVAGEFSNMLLGRLKNELRRADIVFQLSTPTTAIGHDLELASARGSVAWLRFSAGPFRLFVRFDATIEPGLELRASPPSVAPSKPGEMLLF